MMKQQIPWGARQEEIVSLAEEELKPYGILVSRTTKSWNEISTTVYTEKFAMAGRRKIIEELKCAGWMTWFLNYTTGARMITMCKDYTT